MASSGETVAKMTEEYRDNSPLLGFTRKHELGL